MKSHYSIDYTPNGTTSGSTTLHVFDREKIKELIRERLSIGMMQDHRLNDSFCVVMYREQVGGSWVGVPVCGYECDWCYDENSITIHLSAKKLSNMDEAIEDCLRLHDEFLYDAPTRMGQAKRKIQDMYRERYTLEKRKELYCGAADLLEHNLQFITDCLNTYAEAVPLGLTWWFTIDERHQMLFVIKDVGRFVCEDPFMPPSVERALLTVAVEKQQWPPEVKYIDEKTVALWREAIHQHKAELDAENPSIWRRLKEWIGFN